MHSHTKPTTHPPPPTSTWLDPANMYHLQVVHITWGHLLDGCWACCNLDDPFSSHIDHCTDEKSLLYCQCVPLLSGAYNAVQKDPFFLSGSQTRGSACTRLCQSLSQGKAFTRTHQYQLRGAYNAVRGSTLYPFITRRNPVFRAYMLPHHGSGNHITLLSFASIPKFDVFWSAEYSEQCSQVKWNRSIDSWLIGLQIWRHSTGR